MDDSHDGALSSLCGPQAAVCLIIYSADECFSETKLWQGTRITGTQDVIDDRGNIEGLKRKVVNDVTATEEYWSALRC